jgi:hypothetical protein
VVLPVTIDNVDTDLTDDIQRALPAAIQTFGLQHHFNGIRLAPVEHDLLSYDTAYVPYLVVSALGLDALVVAGALGATAMAGEWENKTLVQWRLSPSPMSGLLIGKLIAVVIVSTLAVWVAALLVFFGYGVHPHDAVGTLAALALCCVIFTAARCLWPSSSSASPCPCTSTRDRWNRNASTATGSGSSATPRRSTPLSGYSRTRSTAYG